MLHICQIYVVVTVEIVIFTHSVTIDTGKLHNSGHPVCYITVQKWTTDLFYN